MRQYLWISTFNGKAQCSDTEMLYYFVSYIVIDFFLRTEAVETESPDAKRKREQMEAAQEETRKKRRRRSDEEDERRSNEKERVEQKKREEMEARSVGMDLENNCQEDPVVGSESVVDGHVVGGGDGEVVGDGVEEPVGDDDLEGAGSDGDLEGAGSDGVLEGAGSDEEEDAAGEFLQGKAARDKRREEKEEGITAQIPINLLELTAELAVMEGLSERQHLFMIAGVYELCGES